MKRVSCKTEGMVLSLEGVGSALTIICFPCFFFRFLSINELFPRDLRVSSALFSHPVFIPMLC
jgi:hypothetical protein